MKSTVVPMTRLIGQHVVRVELAEHALQPVTEGRKAVDEISAGLGGNGLERRPRRIDGLCRQIPRRRREDINRDVAAVGDSHDREQIPRQVPIRALARETVADQQDGRPDSAQLAQTRRDRTQG